MAAPMRSTAGRFLDGVICNKVLISSPLLRGRLHEGGLHTTVNASTNPPQRRPHCGPQSWSLLAQQRRTLFGLFKRWRPAQPEPEDDGGGEGKGEGEGRSYRVVRPGRVSARQAPPEGVLWPEYAGSGAPSPIYRLPVLLNPEEMEKMKMAGAMARKILDIGAGHVEPGVTTDSIDEVIHAACVENNVYPSTLNYKGFPKSVCTSVNNVMVHGIPDDRPLEEGDIVNIDFTVFMDGYHGDVSETYTVGSVDDAAGRLIDVARRCRDEAIKTCEPFLPIAHIGLIIQSVAEAEGFYVCPSFIGHGIGRQFHCKPDIWHFANDYPEKMMPGMAFTIEPVVMERRDSFVVAQDGWTVLAKHHTRSAQFEHTILVTREGIEVPTAGPDERFELTAKPSSESPPLDADDGEGGGVGGDTSMTPKNSNSWKF